MNQKIEEYLKLPLTEINKKIKKNNKILDKLWHETDRNTPWEEYEKKCKPYWEEAHCLYTAQAILTPIESVTFRPFRDLEKERCLVPIEEFKEWCKTGCVTNYDGDGVYATENEVSDIDASPRAFYEGYIRKDFKYVCWYNK